MAEVQKKKGDCIQKRRFLPAVIACKKERKLFFDFEMFNFIFQRMLVGTSVVSNATGLFLP
jgi:hypothetical protein